ncbi:hypothetical protein HDU86_006081 [Geranomyces michiganensis]|nr:hypothetical protein HDU86_006081 [Geranomyces michiganensis]
MQQPTNDERFAARRSTTLVSHNINNNWRLPSVGEVIKVRLGRPIGGPASVTSSGLTSGSGSGKANYHLALVTQVALKMDTPETELTVFPIPAYSSNADPEPWLSEQPEVFRKKHLPVRWPADVQQTPIAFGKALEFVTVDKAGNTIPFVYGKPCWVLLEEQTWRQGLTRTWKSYDPMVTINPKDLIRLTTYLQSLNAAPPPSLVVNYGQLSEIQWLIPFDDGDDGEDDGDWQDADMLPVADYLRMLPSRSDAMQRLINEHDVSLQRQQKEHISRWMEGLNT